MQDAPRANSTLPPGFVWLLCGLLLTLCAWLLPVNLKSLPYPLLQEAGHETPSLSQAGLEWTQSEKIGPAALLLSASEALADPGAPELRKALEQLVQHNPELVIWGGYDPFLHPLVKLGDTERKKQSTPALDLLVSAEARKALRQYLANSRSLGVQALLRLRDIEGTGRFVPASKPGGQPLDALLLVSALLYQGEHFSAPLQRQLRGIAENAATLGKLGELEPFFLDLLSLSKRLDWTQLCELLRRTEDFKTVGEYAHLARIAPGDFTLIYAAAITTQSADRVAAFLLQYGKYGLEDLRASLRLGQGATRLLLEKQLPVNRSSSSALGPTASFVLLYPRIALGLRWLGFLLGAFAILRGLDRILFGRFEGDKGAALPHAKSGVIALLLGGLLAVATEPFLLKAAPISEFKLKVSIPALANIMPAAGKAVAQSFNTMDTTTLLSIGFFALLQIAMYLVCLMKIRSIERQSLPALIKLRLMENEENLFDGGLYIGIGGTATALVLQVLQVIEPNLLAAYSSNLFGITCVALVKIRHVRPYKCSLILQGQEAIMAAANGLSEAKK